jgi:hypothetical protein
MKRGRSGLLALALVLAFSGPAFAVAYKNPAQGFKAGETVGGGFYQSASRDVEFSGNETKLDYTLALGSLGFGLGEGLLEFRLGRATGEFDGGESESGVTYGLAYRHNLSASRGLQHGFFAAYQYANVERDDAETDIYETNLGYGVAIPLTNALRFYGGGVFTVFEGTVYAGGGSADFEGADDPAGGFAGLEFDAGRATKLGFEVHLLHERGFALYLETKL